MPVLSTSSEKELPARRAAPKKPKRASPRTAAGDAGDRHMGATENQASPTMPPRPEDDEPKQG
jgi:hypothetical protein